jgi:hypothetical protein
MHDSLVKYWIFRAINNVFILEVDILNSIRRSFEKISLIMAQHEFKLYDNLTFSTGTIFPFLKEKDSPTVRRLYILNRNDLGALWWSVDCNYM